MRKIAFSVLLACGMLNCQTKKQETKQEKKQNNKEMRDQPIYTLAISVANPHEVYLNDLPLIKDHSKGSSNFETPLNNFILKSGIQSVKIVLLPEQGKVKVDKLGIDYVAIKIYRYSHGLSEMSPEKRTLVKAINLKEFKELPLVIKEVQFEADVSYEVKGWSESVDLSKENQEKLKKEVLVKYEELRNILNSGDYQKFSAENKKNDTEVLESLYNNIEDEKEDEDFSKENIKNSTNNMAVLKDFNFVFYGNNRLITLEKTNGQSPLYGDDGEMIYNYFIILHRPKAGAPLEVIR